MDYFSAFITFFHTLYFDHSSSSINFSVDEHLGSFHCLSIVNIKGINKMANIPLVIHIEFGIMSSSVD